MKVKFLQDRTVQAAGGEEFKQGQVYDLPEPSAQRWINRGVAQAHTEEPAPAPAPEAPAKTARASRKSGGAA